MPKRAQPEPRQRKPRAISSASRRMAFGRWLRSLRKRAGMTQRELAESVGVAVRMISAIETGRATPPPERYAPLADALSVARTDFGWRLARSFTPELHALLTAPDED
jgi:transcriptional regulator with XRE-family HTH domain